MVVRQLAARFTTALALVAASVALGGAPASADVQGFSVRLGEAPATFTTGKAARPLTAVAATDRGRRCLKVRWTLIVRTEGVSLDQVRVTRVENGGEFRVNAQIGADAARLVDAEPDPGQLCRGRTVSGRWDVAFTGPDDGSVTLEVRAADVLGRVLSSASTTSGVVTAVAAKPRPSKSVTPSPSAPAEQPVEEAAELPRAAPTSAQAAALTPASGTPSVMGPGLIVGAVLVFLGVGLLLRIRFRNRKNPAWATETQPLPTGFYTAPRRRQR